MGDCTTVARARPGIAVAAETSFAQSRLPRLGIKGRKSKTTKRRKRSYSKCGE